MLLRGIKLTGGSLGPISTCAKCGATFDMTEPFVNYESMEVMINILEQRTSLVVLDAESIADVCINCDPEATICITQQESESVEAENGLDVRGEIV